MTKKMTKKALTVLAFLATLWACSPAQQQRAKSDLNDAFIAGQVQAKLATTVDTATLSLVHVDVDHGAVTLTGQVHSRSERSKVDEAARSVSGVTKLTDRLVVNPKAPTGAQIAGDLALQTKVKGAIAAQSGVNALSVQVSAHAGVVTLEGTVPSKPVHDVVLEAARAVHGVRRVDDRLRIQRA